MKTVYSTVIAVNIFYNKFSEHFIKHGFVAKEYNSYTFNKIVNGEQLNVQFHVDSLKASHEEDKVLTDFVNVLRQEFGLSCGNNWTGS